MEVHIVLNNSFIKLQCKGIINKYPMGITSMGDIHNIRTQCQLSLPVNVQGIVINSVMVFKQ